MGLSFEKVAWVCIGVGMALSVVGVPGFLFRRVELREVGVWAEARFGFG